jgi:hypothetical protein
MMMKAIREERARRAAEAERQRIAQDAERDPARGARHLTGFILQEFWSILEPKRELRFGWALQGDVQASDGGHEPGRSSFC